MANNDLARLKHEHGIEIKVLKDELNALKPTAMSGKHGALLFKDGTISLNDLPKGLNKETRGLPDLKDRITVPATIDYVGRFKAYSDLFNLQLAVKLDEDSLWLMLYKAPKEVRTILGLAEEGRVAQPACTQPSRHSRR